MEAISRNRFWFNKPEAYKDQGGAEFRSAGIPEYVKDLKRNVNPAYGGKMGPKDFFKIASNLTRLTESGSGQLVKMLPIIKFQYQR